MSDFAGPTVAPPPLTHKGQTNTSYDCADKAKDNLIDGCSTMSGEEAAENPSVSTDRAEDGTIMITNESSGSGENHSTESGGVSPTFAIARYVTENALSPLFNIATRLATGQGVAISEIAHACCNTDAAVTFFQLLSSAGVTLGESNANLHQFLITLARFWESRFEDSQEFEYVNKSLMFIAKAKEILGSNGYILAIGDAIPFWSVEGMMLMHSFERLGNVDDLNNAILAWRNALACSDDADWDSKVRLLSNIGLLLRMRFTRLGNIADINEAILVQKQAVELTPNGHANKPPLLTNIGISLQTKFERLGGLADIDNAILNQQQAVDLTANDDPDKPSRLNNLAISLERRFEHRDNLDDINNAILYLQQIADLTPDKNSDKPFRLSNLAASLIARFERLGDLADLDNSILKHHRAVELILPDHPGKLAILNNLGNSLLRRFERLGSLLDLDNAILRFQEAVDFIPDDHADKPSMLNGLGISLQTRFERLGDLADLNNAILKQKQAVDITPDTNILKPFLLSSLGTSLKIRFGVLEDPADIDMAILNQQKAVDLTPDVRASKPSLLSSLGNALLSRFERLKNLADIDNAILSLQKAVRLTPDNHTTKPSLCNNLGNALMRRFARLLDLLDLNKAILEYHQAVVLTPHDHANKPTMLTNLGNSLRIRFMCFKDPDDRTYLISSFREATLSPTGNPSQRFTAARQWAQLLYPDLEPYHKLIELIPQIVWLGKTVEQRYQDLQTLGDAVMEAVSAACAVGAYDSALEWLEQGRAIIWGQILRLRSPLADLETAHPQLAKELKKISCALEVAGIGDFRPDRTGLSLEGAAQQHRRLAEKWESLLTTIRALPDFNDFLKPKSASVLKKASVIGTIVVVNISSHRGDALILRSGSSHIEHVHLATLSFDKLKAAQKSLYQTLRTAGVRVRETSRGSMQKKAQGPAALSNILQMLWVDVAKPVVDYLGYIKPTAVDEPPHITWCLTGPLACLPIHAAGLYDDPSGQEKLFNFVASSYTPSLTALLEGLDNPLTSTRSILTITQEDTPTLTPLPGSVKEVDQIQEQMNNHGVHVTRMDRKQATVDSVSEALNSHSWVHLSCHGKQNSEEPMRSAFYLHDGMLELMAIMKKPLKQAELAYLSACQTASGDATLPNEAMHLAAGMFTAGYRSVVGTLWSIKDNEAPLVAQVFYDRLLNNPQGGVAQALHAAVRALRNSKKDGERDFISWVPYIHIGH